MNNPKIYLAIDNCFASKRWTEPLEWMTVIRDLGINYVEASADNECDPLYMGEDYMKNWVGKVKSASDETGVRVVNLYSGHGTYATLGLAHTDKSVRDRFLNQWLKPMCETAAVLDAGLGFFCHAFSDSVLQDSDRYYTFEDNLVTSLASLAKHAQNVKCGKVGVEQMYSPHQIPWTIKGAKKLIEEVYKRSSSPFYITIDVGHQSGQHKFIMPSREELKSKLDAHLKGDNLPALWLGTKRAFSLFENAKENNDDVIDLITDEMVKHKYMFAGAKDGDTYAWLENLACYSPIIHLQQTNGISSSHLPFTEEYNKIGIIKADKVLKAILNSYLATEDENMPERCENIYLTLEMFTGTADINRAALQKLKQTVEYWRQYIPYDGLSLNELLKNIR